MTRTLLWILGLGLVFAVLATLIAPSVLGWYFTPPEGGVVMMKGDDAVRWGIHRLVQAQLIAFVVGGALGLVISWRFRPRTARARSLSASSTTPETPAAVGPGSRSPSSV
jgi:hypothetical protein